MKNWRNPRMRNGSVRRTVGAVGIGTLIVAVGIVADTGSASGEQSASAALSYNCQFPSGPQPVAVSVSADFPKASTAKTPIAPTNVAMTVNLPTTALADLAKLNAASVSATAQLSVATKQNGAGTTSTWSALGDGSTQIPSTGNLSLPLTGSAPASTPAGSGDVTFAAGQLSLALTALTSTGAATTPPTMPLACALNPNQNPTLATVSMPTSAPATGAPAAPHGSAPQSLDPSCLNAFPLTDEAAVIGRTNVQKLDEATPLGPGDIFLTDIGTKKNAEGDFVLCYSGVLDLSPTTSTVLGFNFMPLTATLSYTQVGGLLVEAWADKKGVSQATAVGQEEIVLSNAKINGTTPLDLGPNCHTVTPVQINLAGVPGHYNAAAGGALQGLVTVPPFTGCGVTENLDSLLTVSLSGPNNLVRMIQGVACYVPVGKPGCAKPPVTPPFH